MTAEGNPSNNDKNQELSKYETKKNQLTEKSEELFNEIEEIETKINNLKSKISDEENNLELLEELMNLEKKEEKLKKDFNDNNHEIQNLNETIFEMKVTAVHVEDKNSDENKEVAVSEQKNTLDQLLEQNQMNRNIEDHKLTETTFHKLYDSEDDLPSVKELAENYRKKAEESINTSSEELQEKIEDAVKEEKQVERNKDEEEAKNIQGKTTKVSGELLKSEVEKDSNATALDEIQTMLDENAQVSQEKPVEEKIEEDLIEKNKKATEKFFTETPKTGTTKPIDNGISSVSFSDTDFKTADSADITQIRPVSLDEMMRLLKRLSEQLVNLAKTSLEKNVKISGNHFNGIISNIQTFGNHIQEIAGRMNMFQIHLNKLTEAFNKRFLEDKAKDHAFNKLYESMQDYKEDFLSKAKKPVFLDLIRLFDDIQKMLSQESNKNLELISDVIIEILYRNDIDVITDAPEVFDRTFQKAIKRIDTDDKEKDRKVAEILKIGFIRGSQIIRPQEVSVYIHNGKD